MDEYVPSRYKNALNDLLGELGNNHPDLKNRTTDLASKIGADQNQNFFDAQTLAIRAIQEKINLYLRDLYGDARKQLMTDREGIYQIPVTGQLDIQTMEIINKLKDTGGVDAKKTANDMVEESIVYQEAHGDEAGMGRRQAANDKRDIEAKMNEAKKFGASLGEFMALHNGFIHSPVSAMKEFLRDQGFTRPGDQQDTYNFALSDINDNAQDFALGYGLVKARKIIQRTLNDVRVRGYTVMDPVAESGADGADMNAALKKLEDGKFFDALKQRADDDGDKDFGGRVEQMRVFWSYYKNFQDWQKKQSGEALEYAAQHPNAPIKRDKSYPDLEKRESALYKSHIAEANGLLASLKNPGAAPVKSKPDSSEPALVSLKKLFLSNDASEEFHGDPADKDYIKKFRADFAARYGRDVNAIDTRNYATGDALFAFNFRTAIADIQRKVFSDPETAKKAGITAAQLSALAANTSKVQNQDGEYVNVLDGAADQNTMEIIRQLAKHPELLPEKSASTAFVLQAAKLTGAELGEIRKASAYSLAHSLVQIIDKTGHGKTGLDGKPTGGNNWIQNLDVNKGEIDEPLATALTLTAGEARRQIGNNIDVILQAINESRRDVPLVQEIASKTGNAKDENKVRDYLTSLANGDRPDDNLAGFYAAFNKSLPVLQQKGYFNKLQGDKNFMVNAGYWLRDVSLAYGALDGKQRADLDARLMENSLKRMGPDLEQLRLTLNKFLVPALSEEKIPGELKAGLKDLKEIAKSDHLSSDENFIKALTLVQAKIQVDLTATGAPYEKKAAEERAKNDPNDDISKFLKLTDRLGHIMEPMQQRRGLLAGGRKNLGKIKDADLPKVITIEKLKEATKIISDFDAAKSPGDPLDPDFLAAYTKADDQVLQFLKKDGEERSDSELAALINVARDQRLAGIKKQAGEKPEDVKQVTEIEAKCAENGVEYFRARGFLSDEQLAACTAKIQEARNAKTADGASKPLDEVWNGLLSFAPKPPSDEKQMEMFKKKSADFQMQYATLRAQSFLNPDDVNQLKAVLQSNDPVVRINHIALAVQSNYFPGDAEEKTQFLNALNAYQNFLNARGAIDKPILNQIDAKRPTAAKIDNETGFEDDDKKQKDGDGKGKDKDADTKPADQKNKDLPPNYETVKNLITRFYEDGDWKKTQKDLVSEMRSQAAAYIKAHGDVIKDGDATYKIGEKGEIYKAGADGKFDETKPVDNVNSLTHPACIAILEARMDDAKLAKQHELIGPLRAREKTVLALAGLGAPSILESIQNGPADGGEIRKILAPYVRDQKKLGDLVKDLLTSELSARKAAKGVGLELEKSESFQLLATTRDIAIGLATGQAPDTLAAMFHPPADELKAPNDSFFQSDELYDKLAIARDNAPDEARFDGAILGSAYAGQKISYNDVARFAYLNIFEKQRAQRGIPENGVAAAMLNGEFNPDLRDVQLVKDGVLAARSMLSGKVPASFAGLDAWQFRTQACNYLFGRIGDVGTVHTLVTSAAQRDKDKKFIWENENDVMVVLPKDGDPNGKTTIIHYAERDSKQAADAVASGKSVFFQRDVAMTGAQIEARMSGRDWNPSLYSVFDYFTLGGELNAKMKSNFQKDYEALRNEKYYPALQNEVSGVGGAGISAFLASPLPDVKGAAAAPATVARNQPGAENGGAEGAAYDPAQPSYVTRTAEFRENSQMFTRPAVYAPNADGGPAIKPARI